MFCEYAIVQIFHYVQYDKIIRTLVILNAVKNLIKKM